MGELSQCVLPSFKDIVAFITDLGKNAWLYSIDISRAYRSMKVCPRDVNLLGICHRGQYYVDLSIPFGVRNGANYCQGLSRVVTAAHIAASHKSMCYIDDNLGGATEDQGYTKAFAGFTSLQTLLKHVGWPSAPEEDVPPPRR